MRRFHRRSRVRLLAAFLLLVSILAPNAPAAQAEEEAGPCAAEKMERRRIAVLDFPMEEVHLYGMGGGREQRIDGRTVRVGVDVDFESVRNLEDEFRARIEALLTQSHRFGVLDRQRPELYEAEKRLLESTDAGPGERARLGGVLGADYLLYGAIDRVIVEGQARTIRITGERRERLVGSAKVRFTVLAAATRQIKWSSSITRDTASPAGLRPEQAAAALLNDIAGEGGRRGD